VRYLTPPFGTYTALSAQLAGSLRHTHARLAEFSEEVAFMGGEKTEKLLIEREYSSVMEHEHNVLNARWWFGCIEEGVIKWLWGSFGVSVVVVESESLRSLIVVQLVLCAIPAFFKLPGMKTIDLGSLCD
jgi:ATP-binding cassette subfamily D (ALD) long-chain fatty acid import protein